MVLCKCVAALEWCKFVCVHDIAVCTGEYQNHDCMRCTRQYTGQEAGQPSRRSAASAGHAGHHSDATVVRWHPNSHLLATGSDDRTVRVWDVRDGHAARVLVGHQGAVCIPVSLT